MRILFIPQWTLEKKSNGLWNNIITPPVEIITYWILYLRYTEKRGKNVSFPALFCQLCHFINSTLRPYWFLINAELVLIKKKSSQSCNKTYWPELFSSRYNLTFVLLLLFMSIIFIACKNRRLNRHIYFKWWWISSKIK